MRATREGGRDGALERRQAGVRVRAEVDVEDRQAPIERTRRSPAAWASMSGPKVYGQPGIGRSTGWSTVSWRNQPIGAPPLWSWPVEWRKRGP